MARLLVVACVVVLATVTAAAAARPQPHLSGVSFSGRIDNLEGPRNIHLDWSGVAITFSFTGVATASIVLSDEGNLFNLFVDYPGTVPPETATSVLTTDNAPSNATTYVMASGLDPATNHVVTIMKRTEPHVGVTICTSPLVPLSLFGRHTDGLCGVC
jgi:hypothetical protein